MVDQVEVIMQAVQRRAMEIVALPLLNRDEHYELIRLSYLNAAEQIGMPHPAD